MYFIFAIYDVTNLNILYICSMEQWDLIINSNNKPFSSIKEVLSYKNLLLNLVKRDFVTVYKQTVLGPIWFFIQPALTTVIYTFIFGSIADISTDGVPKPLFYLSGIILWNYFAECFNQTSDTFIVNQDLFGKVYFPRLILPFSKAISGLIKFSIQFVLLAFLFLYYYINGHVVIPGLGVLLCPVIALNMMLMGLGLGLVFSSLTVKYKDLRFLIQFGIQLLQYASIIIPFSATIGWKKTVLFFNPVVHFVESFRFSLTGSGYVSVSGVLYSVVFTFLVFCFGIILFSRTEKTFIDTV